MSVDKQRDFDHDSIDPISAGSTAAGILRQIAAQLQSANYRARTARLSNTDAREHARRLDFALLHLASVMSEVEVISLVNALRHAADAAQQEYLCEFCGEPIQPWSMLTGEPNDEGSGPDLLIQHSWDQYGIILCKNCHLAIRQVQWQAASQM